MDIEVGKYYANDYSGEGRKETNILYILPSTDETMEAFVKTETMWMIDEEVKALYLNDWIREFVEREATEDEITLFKEHRSKLTELKTYSEVIS